MSIIDDFKAIREAISNTGKDLAPASPFLDGMALRQRINRAMVTRTLKADTDYILIPSLHEMLDVIFPGTSKDT